MCFLLNIVEFLRSSVLKNITFIRCYFDTNNLKYRKSQKKESRGFTKILTLMRLEFLKVAFFLGGEGGRGGVNLNNPQLNISRTTNLISV